MSTKKNLLKISAMVGLLFAFTQLANAQPNIYVCEDGTVILGYSGAHPLQNGDEVVWQKWDVALDEPIDAPEVRTYGGDPSSVTLEIEGSALTAIGEHHYRMYVIAIDPNSCGSDLSDPVEVYKLPALSLALGAPSLAEYCEAADNSEISQPASSEIVATTATSGLPTGILLEYAWSVEHDNNPVANLGDVGSSTANSTTVTELTNTFTMNTTAVGVYEFSATVKYAAETVDGITVKGGCETATPETQTVEVTEKPGKPIITVG